MSPRDLDAASWLSVLERHARGRGNAVAISCRSADADFSELTYAELLERVKRIAALFEAESREGEIIPLCLSRGPWAVAAILAALVSGRVFCCVNPKLRLPQLEHIVASTGAGCALVDESGLLSMRGEVDAQSPLFGPHWWLTSPLPLSRLATKPYQRFEARGRIRALPMAGDFCVRERAPEPARVGACLFTSGSTGTPKGVLVSAQDLLMRARAEAEWFGLRDSDVLLNILPFSFDVGLNQMLSAVLVGAELVVLDSWLPRDILRSVEQRGVTGVSGVPSIWADFMRDGVRFTRSGAHRALRYVTVSGGDLTLFQHTQLPALVDGAQIFKTYGQTEAFRATSLRPEDYARKPGSVGRAFSGVEVFIVREDGSLAAPNELGEVVHTGLGVMLGYLDGRDPDQKLREWSVGTNSLAKRRAIFTGDIGSLDEEGFLYLSGRRDDLVKIQGNRIYPAEVRDHIASFPGVASVEVVVVKTEAQTALAAFVVLDATVEGGELDLAKLRLHLQRQVPSYMIPELFFLREALPRTMTGKTCRVTLAAEAREHLSGTRCAP